VVISLLRLHQVSLDYPVVTPRMTRGQVIQERLMEGRRPSGDGALG